MVEQINEEIKADYFQQNFPNDAHRFVAWYLRSIHLRDMNETRDHITAPLSRPTGGRARDSDPAEVNDTTGCDGSRRNR